MNRPLEILTNLCGDQATAQSAIDLLEAAGAIFEDDEETIGRARSKTFSEPKVFEIKTGKKLNIETVFSQIPVAKMREIEQGVTGGNPNLIDHRTLTGLHRSVLLGIEAGLSARIDSKSKLGVSELIDMGELCGFKVRFNTETSDSKIRRRVGEIERYNIGYGFDPIGNDALCLSLARKHKVSIVCEEDKFHAFMPKKQSITHSDYNRAICLAIIAGHE